MKPMFIPCLTMLLLCSCASEREPYVTFDLSDVQNDANSENGTIDPDLMTVPEVLTSDLISKAYNVDFSKAVDVELVNTCDVEYDTLNPFTPYRETVMSCLDSWLTENNMESANVVVRNQMSWTNYIVVLNFQVGRDDNYIGIFAVTEDTETGKIKVLIEKEEANASEDS